ncbi:MAG: response regulator [Komarekiella atlantica HA4396-MV6]|jgi:CheY-like chemotaxis protein|nr:response regulator [Komarekiella atlantica HA4396-MV6]
MNKAEPTILLVSDVPTQILIKHMLERAFLDQVCVLIMNSKIQAVHYLEEKLSDTHNWRYFLPIVILIDLNLTVLSDFELLKWIKQHPLLIHIPVVIMNNSEDKDRVLEAMNLGANSYFVKSRSLHSLVYLVKAFLP